MAFTFYPTVSVPPSKPSEMWNYDLNLIKNLNIIIVVTHMHVHVSASSVPSALLAFREKKKTRFSAANVRKPFLSKHSRLELNQETSLETQMPVQKKKKKNGPPPDGG